MKIIDFFKEHSRYHKLLDSYNELLDSYNELLEKCNRLQLDYENSKLTLESIKGVQDDNPKLGKCTSDACKTCKYCVKKNTLRNGYFIVGCNKNVVCECFKEADD